MTLIGKISVIFLRGGKNVKNREKKFILLPSARP